MASILLLEDDAALVDGLRYALTENGFTLTVARTVAGATALLASHPPFDLLLLDVTLPDGTGFAVCGAVRAAGSRVPVIFLTAADEEYNVIHGLDMGGDDYITKPFKLGELCSRIRALLRRASTRRHAGVVLGICLAGLVAMGLFCQWQAAQAARLVLQNEQIFVSALLAETVPPATIAKALQGTAATQAGLALEQSKKMLQQFKHASTPIAALSSLPCVSKAASSALR